MAGLLRQVHNMRLQGKRNEDHRILFIPMEQAEILPYFLEVSQYVTPLQVNLDFTNIYR